MYGGAWGRQFIDMVQREGGKATIEDMKSYEAIWEEPLETVFLNIIEFLFLLRGLAASAAAHALQALNLIEQLSLHRMGPYWQDERAFRVIPGVLGFVVSQGPAEVIDALTRKGVDFSAAARGPLPRPMRKRLHL